MFVFHFHSDRLVKFYLHVDVFVHWSGFFLTLCGFSGFCSKFCDDVDFLCLCTARWVHTHKTMYGMKRVRPIIVQHLFFDRLSAALSDVQRAPRPELVRLLDR